jgi:hypothetical protein
MLAHHHEQDELAAAPVVPVAAAQDGR